MVVLGHCNLKQRVNYLCSAIERHILWRVVTKSFAAHWKVLDCVM